MNYLDCTELFFHNIRVLAHLFRNGLNTIEEYFTKPPPPCSETNIIFDLQAMKQILFDTGSLTFSRWLRRVPSTKKFKIKKNGVP